MVYPSKSNRWRLSDSEEEELLSNIFADLLFQKGFRSDIQHATVGAVSANILQSHAMLSIDGGSEYERIFFQEKTAFRSDYDGQSVLIGKNGSRMLVISFKCRLGSFYVCAVVRPYESGFSIINAINVPDAWALTLMQFSKEEGSLGILKISGAGQMALVLVGHRVVPLSLLSSGHTDFHAGIGYQFIEYPLSEFLRLFY